MVTTVSKGGDVGGHAPPPALAEPQPRRALLRRRTDPGALGARVGPLQHARSARAAECCAHDAASTKGAASTGGLALPPSAQGRGAEVRGGCSVPLGALAAWARQVRGKHACGRPDKLTTAQANCAQHVRSTTERASTQAAGEHGPRCRRIMQSKQYTSGKTSGRLCRRLTAAPRYMHSASRSTDPLNRPDAECEPQCTRDRLDQNALAPCRRAHFLHCAPDALALRTTDGLLARGCLRLTAPL